MAKGNGYGFGVELLAGQAQRLGVDTLAVGTCEEATAVMRHFDGDVMVLTPWSPLLRDAPCAARTVHTLARPDDLASLSARAQPARVVLECLTSLRRHGFTPEQITEADQSGVTVEGLALHLPRSHDRIGEVEGWLSLKASSRVFVSYLSAREFADLSWRHPDVEIRPRIGTKLWLGAPDALSVSGTVLAVHPVRAGDRAGYRQRRVPRDGHLVVMTGGTAHGVGLRAPTSAATARHRAAALAKGGLEAVGLALSPFRVADRKRWFLEPPHMQVSLLFLPGSAEPPDVGEEIPVEVRYTTTSVDRVVITGLPDGD